MLFCLVKCEQLPRKFRVFPLIKHCRGMAEHGELPKVRLSEFRFADHGVIDPPGDHKALQGFSGQDIRTS